METSSTSAGGSSGTGPWMHPVPCGTQQVTQRETGYVERVAEILKKIVLTNN